MDNCSWRYKVMGRAKSIMAAIGGTLAVPAAYAHCPLCTIGAGAAAVGAAYLGVSNAAIGVFIGAFAVAIGSWIHKKIKRKFIWGQESLIVIISFATTVLPLLPIITGYTSVYISWVGDYGSLFNRTYLINLFLMGSIVGAVIMAVTPAISKRITHIRKKTLPFQGVTIIFALLIIASIIFQVSL
jgi:hypothetical protein